MKALKAAALACLFIPPLSMADDSLLSIFSKLDSSQKRYPDIQRIEEIVGKLTPAGYYQFGRLAGVCRDYQAPSIDSYKNYEYKVAMKTVAELVQKPLTPKEAQSLCQLVNQSDLYITGVIKRKP